MGCLIWLISNSWFTSGNIQLGDDGRRAMTIYDFLAPVYGAWAALTEAKAHRRAMALLRRLPCERLLEVAVGTGKEIATLASDPGRGLSVGVDLSGAMLKRARRRVRRTPVSRALLCQADAHALPLRAGSFDCILSCYMIDLIPDTDIPVVLREFHRVLRSRGLLVLVVMGEQARVVQQAWMMLFRHIPALVGGCRPIQAAEYLRNSGWEIESQERITQSGFRNEVLTARTLG